MACSRFLKFEATEIPHWREDKRKYNESIPNVSGMLSDILKYRRTWMNISKIKNKKDVQCVKREMFIDFLLKLQINENIGIADKGTFEGLVIEEEEKEKINQTGGRKRAHRKDVDDESGIKTKRPNVSGDSGREQINTGSQESLPNSLEFEESFGEASYDHSKVTEARNLLRGYWHLKNEVATFKAENTEGPDYLGELDVDVCIQHCHQILMEGLIKEGKTAPGRFSTLPRSVAYNDETFLYPSYMTEEIAYTAVDNVVTQYNLMVEEISKEKDEMNKIALSMKCATVLLFAFLTLHPFADGNGRLARLLCSHSLRQLCPFPTAIYNVFSPTTRDDYIVALISARQSFTFKPDQHKFTHEVIEEAVHIMELKPADLCALVIESNWFSWRHFLRKLGEDIQPLLECEKKLVHEVSLQQ